jgi:hypothetical protein
MQLALPNRGDNHEAARCRRHQSVLLLQTGSVLLLGRVLLQEIEEEAPEAPP